MADEIVDANATSDGWHFCTNSSTNLPGQSWFYLFQASSRSTRFQMAYNTLDHTLRVRNRTSAGAWIEWV